MDFGGGIDISRLAPAQRERLKVIVAEEMQRRLAKRSLIRFMEIESGGRWRRAKHLELVCSVMEDVSAGRKKRVIITLPPRHGKSEVVSKKFPAWHLNKDDDPATGRVFKEDEIIIATYAVDLARDFSIIARDTISNNSNLMDVKISSKTNSAERWTIAGHRGGLVAAGVGGPITGRGARILIIDDPFKNHEEANSQTVREKIWNWFTSTAYTRLTPDGAIVVVATRWHEDDLIGRLLKKQEEEEKAGIADGDKWEVINLPAEAEENDPLGRQPGEALWPEYGFDLVRLAAIKRTLGSYQYAALYQQRPSPAGGSIFKREWFRYFEDDGEYFVLHTELGQSKRVQKRLCWCFQTVDPAISLKEENDYFVVATWYVTKEKDLLLFDVLRTRIEGPEQRNLMAALHKRYNPIFQAVEDKTFGTNLIQELRREGYAIKRLKADTDKLTRALSVSPRYETFSVFHRAGADWLTDFEDELIAFPRGAHDDCVDVTSYAGLLLRAYDVEDNPLTLPEDMTEAEKAEVMRNLEFDEQYRKMRERQRAAMGKGAGRKRR